MEVREGPHGYGTLGGGRGTASVGGWGAWEQNVKRSWCKGLQGADLGKVWLLPCAVGAWWVLHREVKN